MSFQFLPFRIKINVKQCESQSLVGMCSNNVPVSHCKDTYYFDKTNNYFKKVKEKETRCLISSVRNLPNYSTMPHNMHYTFHLPSGSNLVLVDAPTQLVHLLFESLLDLLKSLCCQNYKACHE